MTAAPNGARSPVVLSDGTVLYTTLRYDGWALVRARPGRGGQAPTAQPPEPFDSAPPVPLRETRYASLPSLLPRYWLPHFVDADRAGFFVGATTAGSDAVGRYAYAAHALYSWESKRAMGSFALISHALVNPAVDFIVSTDWSYLGRTPDGVFDVSALDMDAALGFTFQHRRWRSGASLRVAAEYEGVRYALEPEAVVPGADLVGGSVSLGLARYLTAPIAVSPQDGFEFSATYRRREAQGSARWSDEVVSRLTLYLPFPSVGTFARPVLALRGAVAASQGPLGDRFSVGGGSGARFNYLAGRVVGGGSAFFVRGYLTGARRGTRAVAAGAELRLPLLLVGRALGHLPVGADMVSLSLFADVGDAWDAGSSGRLTRLAATGAEVVADLTFNYDTPLRARLGVAKPLESLAPRWYVALGSPF